MNEERDALEDLVGAVLDRGAATAGSATDAFPTQLWGQLRVSGVVSLCSPENGGSLTDAVTVARVVGGRAADLPLTESSGLAVWLLGAAGLPEPEGVLTFSALRDDDDLHLEESSDGWIADGVLHRVPWGRHADHVVTVLPVNDGAVTVVVLARPDAVERGRNIADEPRDTLRFEGARVEATSVGVAPVRVEETVARAALLRAASTAGACRQVLEMSLEHAALRKQFGRPIADFQAVQHHLVHIAEQTACVDVAVRAACLEGEDPTLLAIATAKIAASHAAADATRRAHQVIGAVGTTREHPLHRFTTRLWAWQNEYGSEQAWSRRLGADVMAQPVDDLWGYISMQSAGT